MSFPEHVQDAGSGLASSADGDTSRNTKSKAGKGDPTLPLRKTGIQEHTCALLSRVFYENNGKKDGAGDIANGVSVQADDDPKETE